MFRFLSGAFSLFERLGTSVYKGVMFAAVGFAAELVGTALSKGLIAMRKKMDPEFETPNKPTPTLLNADTWALHMSLHCNLRYQTLKAIEFATSQEFLLHLEVRLMQSLPLALLGLGLSGEWMDQFISWASHLIFKLGWYIFNMGSAGH
ncbi:hypothetical protein HS088_TW05G00632 [Tripterygium wilfordii]|uniref:Uncharacterized protein n=1 Tax=Tripterygium wilfordii TaxID=458696 RepID=A0A7J7DNG0_TRIWF|nr:hypothetical protein HS088_TW05G00632 [Tripterygium wilfordii]